MSLGKQIADAFAKSYNLQPGVDRSKIDKLGTEISDAIVEFIVKQPFEVKELKAVVELDKLKNGGIDADVKPSTLLGPYQPLFDFLKKLKDPLDLATAGAYGKIFSKLEKAVKSAALLSSDKGAKTKDLDMKKEKGLETKGYAYIGGNEIDDENLGTTAIIQLEEDKVVDR